ncbi:MAG: murein L,D-transpeptidase [Bdellovibrionales bacterium]
MALSRISLLSLMVTACLCVAPSSYACEGDQYCPPERAKNRGSISLDFFKNEHDIRPVETPAEDVQLDIQGDTLYALLEKGNVAGERLNHLATLRSFYNQRNFQPVWLKRDRLNDDAREIIKIFETSWSHGLNPFSYHLNAIRSLSSQSTSNSYFAIEVLLSDAFIKLGQDLTGIRIDPSELKSHKRFWQKPLTADYLLSLLGSDDVDDVIASIGPRGETYNRLRKELVSLVEEKPEPYEAILPIRLSGSLRPYEQHSAVRDLRVRFNVRGEGNLYDDVLAAAVLRFQKENNLEPDGIIGSATLRVINQTRKQKIHQIIANLERLRWVPEDKPDKFVIVNVPSAMLWAVEDNRVAFDMPVIVGRKKRPTNIFITEITGIRLNPTWTVPPTIKKEDILPELIEDARYLDSKGMELVYGRGKDALTLDPTAIDWTTVSEDELKSLRMIQVPGAHNPLGYYRVLMPNSYNIYLHDTNERHYFSKPGRAVSSGCVRLKDPRRMADFILREKRGWSDEKTDKVLDSGDLSDLYVQNTIPVYIVYYTAWVDDDGSVVLGHDLYDYDEKVIKMLSNLDEIFIPVDNT